MELGVEMAVDLTRVVSCHGASVLLGVVLDRLVCGDGVGCDVVVQLLCSG